MKAIKWHQKWAHVSLKSTAWLFKCFTQYLLKVFITNTKGKFYLTDFVWMATIRISSIDSKR